PFLIVGFEFTILFSVLGNILGFITLAGLPDYKGLKHHEPQCTGDRFGIVAACPEGEGKGLMTFFQERGGESRLLEESYETRAPSGPREMT
ncbi:MAG: quinol:electron acceptor oxidoreductase subunit ActD, partial [Pseudomonadota bacterium]